MHCSVATERMVRENYMQNMHTWLDVLKEELAKQPPKRTIMQQLQQSWRSVLAPAQLLNLFVLLLLVWVLMKLVWLTDRLQQLEGNKGFQ
jgi:hypothetical protein